MSAQCEVPRLKLRDPQSHKGTHGRALLIGGSRGMSGAIALSGLSCLKSGAGLVTLAVPDRCLEVVAQFSLCFMTVPVADDAFGCITLAAEEKLLELSSNATSVGIGPGMSRSQDITAIVHRLYTTCSCPMVLDADALNAIASLTDGLLDGVGQSTAPGPRILTPHIGEFRRLARNSALSPDECQEAAKRFAAENKVIVVLKGHRTLVTDGTAHFYNTTGNPGMGTGGSGDVLTGIITALLGQGYSAWEASVLGVNVHGLAGDLARDRLGEISLTADEIVHSLPVAFQTLKQQQQS